MFTALPNLHPAVVHFPLVLVPMAFMLDLATTGREGWRSAVLGLWAAAAATTTAAFLLGRQAADGLVGVEPAVQPHIGDHADLAWYTLLLIWPVLFTRSAASWAEASRKAYLALRILSGALAVASLGTLFLTAEAGGVLVYQLGVGVVSTECPVPEPAPAPAALPGSLSLVDEDGTLTWSPAPGEGLLLGVPEVDGTMELTLDVKQRETLLLPGEFGDLQLNVWMDLTRFEGEVWLLHHYNEPEGGALAISTTGRARLVSLGPHPVDLSSRTIDLIQGASYSVSAAGSHLKGLLNGKMVAHGHTGALPPGRVGLRFIGAGAPVISRLEVVRLRSER